MKKPIFILFMMFLSTPYMFAKDKMVKCGGTYPYTYSEHISHAEAKAKAIENAIIMALAEKLGTTITSQSFLELSTTAGDRYDQMSRLQVKGKLVRHIEEPEVSPPAVKDNLFTINVKVSFYARPIEYAPTEFETLVLRNGMENRFESRDFRSNDKFYMSFKSPKEGYVAIFFEDRRNVICMLPYIEHDDEPYHVGKGEKHVLFNTPNNTYHMSCGQEPEINYVHVIFSPRKFIDGDLVREMSCKKFRDWLSTRQSYDSQMQVQSIMIKVNPEESL